LIHKVLCQANTLLTCPHGLLSIIDNVNCRCYRLHMNDNPSATGSPVLAAQTPPPLPPSRRFPSKYFVGILLVVLLVGVLIFSLVGKKTGQPAKKSPLPSLAVQPSPIATITPLPQDAVVSFATAKGKVYLRYKNLMYEEETQPSDLQGRPVSDLTTFTWKPLVPAPTGIDTNYGDSIFSFKVHPQRNDFAFVMFWHMSADKDFSQFAMPAYHYNVTSMKLTKINLDYSKNKYPKIEAMSPDGKYLAFIMFSCWGCEPGVPTIQVVDIEKNTVKDIGLTSYFALKNNGEYEYKEYVRIDCPSPTEDPTVCSKDKDTLPLKIGKI
jgi:hypothetical protein